MSTPLTVNGITFQYPTANDQSWGQQATLWATAVTAAIIPKAGGTFALTGEVNFGTQYGLKVKSLRLNNTDVIAWRNAANSADLPLTVNASNQLTFNGLEVFNGPGYVNNLAHAAPATLSGGYPGLYATVNANGKLNLTAPGNSAHTSFTLSTGGMTGQIRQNFLNVATSSIGDQYNQYLTFDSNPLFYGTGSVLIPKGTTAQRSAATGTHAGARNPFDNALATDSGSFRYNTDYKTTEYHDGRRWVPNAYADQLRVAPQFFDDFAMGSFGWNTSVATTTAPFSSTSYPDVFGATLVTVNSGGGTGTAQFFYPTDINPKIVDYAEFRLNCSLGGAVSCGISLSSGASNVVGQSGQGIMFYCNFTGGSSSAHGTGNWFARVQDANQTLTQDTGIAVAAAGTMQTMRFEIAADQKTITYFINGTQAAQLALTAVIAPSVGGWYPYFTVTQANFGGGTYYGSMIADYALVKFLNIRN